MTPPHVVALLVRATSKVWTRVSPASRLRWTARLNAFIAIDGDPPRLPIANARAIVASAAAIGVLLAFEALTGAGVPRIAELCTFLILLAVIVTATLRSGSHARAEALCLLRVRERIRLELGFRGSLQAVLGEVVDLYHARGVRLQARHEPSGRELAWVLAPSAGHIVLRRMASLACDHPSNAVTAPFNAPFLAGDWSGRVTLIGAGIGRDVPRAARLFARLVRELAPQMRQVQVLARLRSQVRALERARLARVLHDDVIQSLIAAEMRLNSIEAGARRRLEPDTLASECARIRDIVHAEVLNLRDLMTRMKPIDVSPDDLPAAIAELVDRFSYNHGMDVTFDTNVERATLSHHASTEIVRIVREALINARKHGGARRAAVRLTATNTGATLVIEDDGRGFDPEGRSTTMLIDAGASTARQMGPRHLDRSSPGLRLPTEIRESVRSLRGELFIESIPKRGTHLRIVLPADTSARDARDRLAAG